jgi:hypothetical protein
MLVTKIQIEKEDEEKLDLIFSSGNYTGPDWIDMTIEGKKFCVEVEEIMDALLPFHAKLSRNQD